MVIVSRFPEPPNRVREVLKRLRALGSGDLGAVVTLEQEPGHVPRPWDPANCDDELRFDVWTWCEQVATWINHDFAWRGATSIPPCWPQHPYLAHEIALLACQRYLAGTSTDPRLLDEWTRIAFPAFVERMVARTGEGCHTEHADWPGAAAFHRFTESAGVDERDRLLSADSRQPHIQR